MPRITGGERRLSRRGNACDLHVANLGRTSDLALPRGDNDFRLAVDRALSHIYRAGEIAGIFERTFGGKAKPSQILQTLYLISGLPD